MKVLMSVASSKADQNPYITQLVDSLEGIGIKTNYWSWRAAILEQYDIVHLHWPERLYQARGRAKSKAKSFTLLVTLAWWKMRGTKIVWTAHNTAPHEPLNRFEAYIDRCVRRSVRSIILLNRADVKITGLRKNVLSQYVPHGHYKAWYQQTEHGTPANQVAFVGMIRAYKGIENLIDAFESDERGPKLIIAGKSNSPVYTQKIQAMIDNNKKIELIPRYMSDSEIGHIITDSRALILPYTNLYNSGVVFLSLSLNRPVIVPKTPTTELLKEEFGSEWIRTYDAPITKSALSSALDKLPANFEQGPDMTGHEWSLIAEKHRTVYKATTKQLPTNA